MTQPCEVDFEGWSPSGVVHQVEFIGYDNFHISDEGGFVPEK